MALLPRSKPLDISTRDSFRAARERRLAASIGWRYSLIFVAALIAIGLVRFTDIGPDNARTRVLSFRVTDGASGAPLGGAAVSLGDASMTTDNEGIARFRTGWQTQPVIVSIPGYAQVATEVTRSSGHDHSFALLPDSSATIAQPAGTVDIDPDETQVAPTQATSNPTPDEAPAVALASPETRSQVATDQVVAGKIVGPDGKAVIGSYVRLGDRAVKADKRGRFEIETPEDGAIRVMAPGHAPVDLEAKLGESVRVELQAIEINAVYLSGAQVGDDATVRRLVRLANDTEINAIVVDIKEYLVFYDTQVEFFREADMAVDAFDPAKLVRLLHKNGIYAIARQVVFKDPIVAEAYPDFAVKVDGSDELWRGGEGEAWVNPFARELWQPNIDLAAEAAAFGFDEIQYDYIRFPSDGDLSTADFGPEYDEEGRVGAIADFLKASQAALKPLGVMFGVDVFGVAAIFDDDQGIGQRLADIAPHVDYICPMVYPSHFTVGIFGFDEEPNALPFETIQLSLASARDKIPGHEHKLRPWLQDFTYGEPAYGVSEVKAQIDATAEEIGFGYMLWNANVEFTAGALGAGG